MNKHGAFVAGVALLLVGSLSARAADVVVIANQDVKADSISASDLRSIYLQEQKGLSDGTHVEPVLAKGGAAHALFLRRYLGKNDDDLRNYYRTLVFTGTGLMPKTLASDREVVEYVARTRGAIGYVNDSAALNPAVKVLTVKQNSADGERRVLRRVEPVYPETLQKLGIGGTVRLEVVISSKGTVEHVSILGGNPALAESAVKAVMQWVYAPASGQSRLQVSIPFQSHP